jgi:hypothetical protein
MFTPCRVLIRKRNFFQGFLFVNSSRILADMLCRLWSHKARGTSPLSNLLWRRNRGGASRFSLDQGCHSWIKPQSPFVPHETRQTLDAQPHVNIPETIRLRRARRSSATQAPVSPGLSSVMFADRMPLMQASWSRLLPS